MLAAAHEDDERTGPIPVRPGSLRPILQRVALAANSSLDADEVLERLATLTLEAIPADRCAIFLLDERSRLCPRMGVGRLPNEAEFERFLRTEPIDLRDETDRWTAFVAGRAILIPDVQTSELVPDHFAEQFGARCVVAMPLVASGEPLGLLSVDWTTPDHACTPDEIGLIEAIGSYVALAVRNSKLYEGLASKARTLERLVGIAGALNSAASMTSVLQLVCSAFTDLLEAQTCAVRLGDPRVAGAVRTVASHSTIADGGKSKLAAENESLHALWTRSPEPAVVTSDGRTVALFPLLRSEELLGYVFAAFPDDRDPSAESLATGHALAELAAAATGRAHLHQELNRRLQRVEIMHRLSDVVAGSAELGPALRKLNEALPSELGIKLDSISLANPSLREAIGAHAPGADQLEAIRSWRSTVSRGSTPAPRHAASGVLVPIVHRRRVLGALAVSLDDEITGYDDELLTMIASGCAEVIHKAALHRELSDSERRLAVVAERERIARDLHDSVGQVLTGLGMRLVSYTDEAPDRMWRERLAELRDLASRGSTEIRDAIQSMLFLQVRREGLARSLRDLARKFEATTGVDVSFRVSGDVVSLPTHAEDALFRVAHEALRNAERHSGATRVTLLLTYRVDGAAVCVTDDGVGLGDKDPFVQTEGHYGIEGLRTLLEGSGGELEVCDLMPHGVRIEGSITVRRPRR
jgi:signal transduction histidine kinase